MSQSEYRVTYGGCGRIAPVEERWTSATAARACAAERIMEGHAGVRIWKRVTSDWQPIDQSFTRQIIKGQRDG